LGCVLAVSPLGGGDGFDDWNAQLDAIQTSLGSAHGKITYGNARRTRIDYGDGFESDTVSGYHLPSAYSVGLSGLVDWTQVTAKTPTDADGQGSPVTRYTYHSSTGLLKTEKTDAGHGSVFNANAELNTTTTFAYTGDGLRHSRTVGQDTTVLTWDIAAGLPVVLDDGDARYVYGAAGLISQVTVADTYYYLPDGLGSTMVTTDSAGNVANAYTYDVFGAPRSQSGAQANEFQFAGEQVDGSTGLQYLRARYYDFETGRFISREPLAASPGWGGNPFGYASANPVPLVDPTGEAPVDANGCRLDDYQCQSQPQKVRCYEGVCFPPGSDEHFRINSDGTVEACSVARNWSGLGPGGRTTACEPYDPVARTIGSRSGDPLHLVGEYVLDTIYGCKADPALCAATVGTQAATALIGAVVSAGVAGACVESGGLTCTVAVRGGSGILHTLTFRFLNQGFGRKLRAKGKEARGIE